MTETLTRVMAIHALHYCERLFYLEEVEEIRRADEKIYQGRRLHAELEANEITYELESETLGLFGKVDALKSRDGQFFVYEHKKGRSNKREAWESDRMQVIAYCALVEEASGKTVDEGRIRYHADNVLVHIPFDEKAKADLKQSVDRANWLRQQNERPPVTDNPHICRNCSLAPICLPEENRFDQESESKPARLFPPHESRRIIHVLDEGTRVEKLGEQLMVIKLDGTKKPLPGQDVASIVLHGAVQMTTQAIHYCAANDIAVHWLSGGGNYVGSLASGVPGVQRRIRQYKALQDQDFCLKLAKQLAACKVENQLKFLLRGSRGDEDKRQVIESSILYIRHALKNIPKSQSVDELRGYEGNAGQSYFQGLATLVNPPDFHFNGRHRRPPTDRFNSLLSFFYSLIYKDCVAAILTVGLESSFGFMHTPRSAAQPLALDLMEIFRVILGDMPILASVNRQQWQVEDFTHTPYKVWLSDEGKKKALKIYEERKQEEWKHPVLNYSLSYQRTIELEVRLLEKEWNGEADLFAKLRIR